MGETGATTSTGIPRWRARDHLPSLALLAAGLAATLALAAWTRASARGREMVLLERRASNLAVTLGARLEVWVEILRQLESFFLGSDDVTRADFNDFVRPTLAGHPEITALEWAPLIDAAARPALEARAHAEGFPGYVVRDTDAAGRFVPAAARAAYLPIFYQEPPDERALGLDLMGEARRFAPVDAARDRGEPVLSGRIRLVQDPESVYSVALYGPIYRRGAATATVDQRRAAFTGAVGMLFRLESFFRHALQGYDVRGLAFTLRDVTAEAEPQILHESAPGVAAAAVNWRQPLRFAGRTWELSFVAEPEAAGAYVPVLVFGIALSLVAGGLLSSRRVIGRLRRQVAAARSVGPYELGEKLGEGGIGAVYKARHALLRRPTAVKILQAGHAREADLKRFEREVQAAAGLTHPNTIMIFDYGRTKDDTFYYAMEYLDGENLEKLVEREGPLAPARVAHILAQACGALAEAHAAGLIHRDVKPSNLMLCRRGGMNDVVKVLDFGMVKERGVTSDVSEAGISYGTPLYLSPESITRPDEIDGRTDLYALGLVGYFLLTGIRAAAGATLAEVLHQHLNVVPDPPSERSGRPIPHGLEDLVMQCLQKDPARRPQSAAEVQERLLALDLIPKGANVPSR